MKLFTVRTEEWDGGSELVNCEYVVKATDKKDARRRFKAHLKRIAWTAKILRITPTQVIT